MELGNGDCIIGLWKVLKIDREADGWQTGGRAGPTAKSVAVKN